MKLSKLLKKAKFMRKYKRECKRSEERNMK